MAYSYVVYQAEAGVLGPYTINFPALEKAHFKAQIDGVDTEDFTINSAWTELTFGSNTEILGGEIIRIYRQTPQTNLVDFQASGSIQERDLDILGLQDTYRSQEHRDYLDQSQAEIITNQVSLNAHIFADTPHGGHENKVEKGVANGYAGLGSNALVPAAQLGTGAVGDGDLVLADDGTWVSVSGLGGGGDGEANTLGDNATGDETLVATPAKVGEELRVKRITAGPGISLTSDDDQVTIESTATGGGEVNTLADAGAGAGEASLVKAKTGAQLNVRVLSPGAGVTLTENADDVTIDTDGEPNTLSDSGAGESLILAKVGDALGIKKLEASGTHITLTPTATSIQISSDGEANTLADTGAGLSLRKAKVGTALGVKKLIQGSNVTLTDGTDGITIAAAAPVGEANTITAPAASGVSLVHGTPKSGVALQTRKLVAGPGVTITSTGTDQVTIETPCGSVDVIDGGLGTSLIQDPSKSGNDLLLKSLEAGSGITLTPGATSVLIEATAGTGEANTLASPAGSGVDLRHATPKSGLDLQLRKLVGAGTVSIAQTGTDQVTITGTETGEANTLAAPSLTIGAISLLHATPKSGTALQVRKLVAGSNVAIAQSGVGDVTISASSAGEANTLNSPAATGVDLRHATSKSGVSLQLRKLVAGSANITITATGDDQITLDTAAAGEANTISSPAASGIDLVHATPKSGDDLRLRKLVAGTDIGIAQTGTDQVTISNTAPTDDLLSASGGTQIVDGVHVTSAVNHVQITNAITAANPLIAAAGSDTNINLVVKGKGTGDVYLGRDGLLLPITKASANPSWTNDGGLFFNDTLKEWFYWDNARGKFLSMSLLSDGFGRTDGAFTGTIWTYGGYVPSGSANPGPRIPWDVTIVGWSIGLNSLTGSPTIQIRRDLTTLITRTPAATTEDHVSAGLTPNVNFAAGGHLNVNVSAGAADRPLVKVFYRRRST